MLKEAVQGWVEGSRSNYGVVLIPDSPSEGLTAFRSREGGPSPYLSVTYAFPDLTASNVSVSDTSVDPLQQVTVDFRISNIGEAPSQTCSNEVYWSINSTISTADTSLGTANTSSIPAGEHENKSLPVTIPADATPGQTYYIGVVADTSITSGETDRSNNASAGIAVTVNPAPAANLTQWGVTQSSVSVDQSFEVYATLRNDGGPGDHGGISISFPDLTGTDGSMPPYNSAKADVATASTTFAEIHYFDQGDTIYADFVPMNALHLLVEPDHASWPSGQEKSVTLSVTPHQTGSLKVRIRGWISKGGPDGYGPPVYRDPDGSGGGREQDQQSYWSEVVTVTVTASPEITSFAINNGDASTTSRTVTLNNTCENAPTHYMASESSDFSGASWQPYSTAPSFTITSPGDGTKWVYFKVKNDDGESPSGAADTIELTTPPPSVNLTSFGTTQSSVTLGESFEIYATVQNDGGPGQRGGISISFPDLTDTDGSMPPYNSPIADVTTAGTSTLPVGYFAAGDTIYVDGSPVPAQHLLVEGEEPSWASGQVEVLRLIVTPKQAGQLKLRIRGWIEGQGASPVVYRDPDASGGGREQDQQGHWSEVVTVNVEPVFGGARAFGVAFPTWYELDYDIDITDPPSNPTYCNESLDALSQSSDINTIEIVPHWYMVGVSDILIRRGEELPPECQKPDYNHTPSDDDVRNVIEWANNRGWKVLLKPHIDVLDPANGDTLQDGRKNIAPSSPGFWFESYRAFIGTYAAIAAESGCTVDLFCIGTELSSMSSSDYLEWALVADTVRNAGYYRSLTYAANWDEYPSVCFWDLVHVIGIDAYFRLEDEGDPGNYPTHPSTTWLVNAWKGEVTDLCTWWSGLPSGEQKPFLFTEIGYRGIPSSYRFPEPASPGVYEDDLYLQKRCYDAAITVWQDEHYRSDTSLHPDIASFYDAFRGVVFWAWNPYLPNDIDPIGSSDCERNGWTVYQKPAAESLGLPAVTPPACYSLTLSFVNGSWGSVDVDPDQASYSSGTPVALTALPNEGKAFKHWIIYDPAHPGDDAYAELDTDLSTSVVMDADREVTAVFKCGTGLGPLFPLLVIGVTASGFMSRRRRSGD